MASPDTMLMKPLTEIHSPEGPWFLRMQRMLLSTYYKEADFMTREMRNNLTPQDYIRQMFRETQDGKEECE